MSRHIQPAKLGGLGAPQVLGFTPEGTATFKLGAPVAIDTGELVEFTGGATVTGLLGFALQACTSGEPSFGDEVEVAIADDNVEYFAQVLDSGGGVVLDIATTPLVIGGQYGLVKHTDDEWYVDQDDTTNVVVEITKNLPTHNGVLFKVLGSAREYA